MPARRSRSGAGVRALRQPHAGRAPAHAPAALAAAAARTGPSSPSSSTIASRCSSGAAWRTASARSRSRAAASTATRSSGSRASWRGTASSPPSRSPSSCARWAARATAPPDVVVPDRHPARAIRPPVAVRAAIARGVQRIILNDARTRLGEVEPLHQMRVGTRRLRSDLRTFRELCSTRTGRDAARRAEVARRRARRRARPRRDAGAAARATAQDLEPRARRPVRGARGAPRGGARAPARRPARPALRGPAGPARGGGRGAAADGRGRPARPRTCCRRSRARSWRKLARAGRALEDTSPDEDFHEVRKRAKQARYAAEAVAPALGAQARPRRRSASPSARPTSRTSSASCRTRSWPRRRSSGSRSSDSPPGDVNFAAGRLLERQHAAGTSARDGLRRRVAQARPPEAPRWMT